MYPLIKYIDPSGGNSTDCLDADADKDTDKDKDKYKCL